MHGFGLKDREVVSDARFISPISDALGFEGAFRRTPSPYRRAMICAQCQVRRERDELFARLFGIYQAAEKRFAGLTDREYQIMKLVLAGHPSKNIAADLGISQRTVENHRASIMKKTAAKSLPELARLSLVADWAGMEAR